MIRPSWRGRCIPPRVISLIPTDLLPMARTFVFTLASAALLSAAVAPVEAQDLGRTAPDSARADSVARRAHARELSAMRVVGERANRARYAVTSSRTATKTDTPLRDTPQSA